ncbi:MAG: hydroxyacylglutathione hydrolase [Simkaniaceae bacterium]|nr:hydroxyacylglutathione hydrolase [Simkaniaceae bacterium]
MTKLLENTVGDVNFALYAIPSLEDNYIYALSCMGKVLVVDPGEARPVKQFIDDHRLDLSTILITHHHSDHVMGLTELKKRYNCYVIAPDESIYEGKVNIGGVDQTVVENEELLTGPFVIKTLLTPGHCLDHICYYFENIGVLFSGDALFGAGCGKVFDGSMEQHFNTVQKLAKLPPETVVCFGHEYTLKNLEFAREVDSKNPDVIERFEQVKKLRADFAPTTPSTIGLELKTNPFLRCSSKEIREHLQMPTESDLEVFEKLRALKDAF